MSKKQGGSPPQKVDGQRAVRTLYYKDKLKRLTKGRFDLQCPEEWDSDYVLNTLMCRGYVIITDTVAGILPVTGSLTGPSYNGVPTKAVIGMPFIGNFTRTIGVDCSVIFLDRISKNVYFTFNSMWSIYAQKLASADCAIDVNLMNSRVAHIIEAETKAQADTIKAIYDDVYDGEPLVVYKKDTLSVKGMNAAFNNVKQSYIANDVQDTKRSIMNEFLTDIGVNNLVSDKKERQVVDEVNSNNIEIEDAVSVWKNNLEICMKKTKKLFPELNFSLKLKEFESRTEGDNANQVDRPDRDLRNNDSNE